MAKSEFLWDRTVHPFGQSWEEWAANWYKWMISIPKKKNPCVDKTGNYCSVNQTNENVWFLAGTFGNTIPIKRKCRVPSVRAIFFPILVKEDSFVEDLDLNSETELSNRAKEATDMVREMKVSIDGQTLFNVNEPINEETLKELEAYRVHSDIFSLEFPEGNIYDIRPGVTRSVSDGFWLFVKPLDIGKHFIHFQGETKLDEDYTINRMMETEVYSQILDHMKEKRRFRVDVLYELSVT